MKIFYTEEKQVNISEREMTRVAIAKLERLTKGEYLREKDGIKWIAQDEDWRHGSVSEQYIAPATELDLAVFTVLRALRNEKL